MLRLLAYDAAFNSAASSGFNKYVSSRTIKGRIEMKNCLLIISLLSVLLVARVSWATTYYVATTGNDSNSGTQSAPFKTINKAAKVVQAGDTVRVLLGQYTVAGSSDSGGLNSGILTQANGTDSSRIRYVSDIKWGAKIVSSGAYDVWRNLGNYVDIEGFEVVGDSASNQGIDNYGSFVRIIGNKVHGIPATTGCSNGNGGAGINNSNYSASDNDIIGNIVYDIGPLPADGLPVTSYCNLAHGIYSSNLRGHIQNNIVYRVAAFGIHLWHAANNVVVSNNLAFNNGAKTDEGAFVGGGIVVGAGDSPGGITLNKTTVSNNIIRNNRGNGINESGKTGLWNRFFNNILFGNGINTISTKTGLASGTLTSDPQMVNFQINGTGDYHLKSASPAIDAGTTDCAPGTSSCVPSTDLDGVTRPQGLAYDIGPYESSFSKPEKPLNLRIR
jgi:hypothetical protein